MDFNLEEALKETKMRHSLEEKAEIILQIITCKMKEQDVDSDTVATMEIKCKLDADTHLVNVPRLYEIIARVTYISGRTTEIYKTNLTLMQPCDKRTLMNAMVLQAQRYDFVHSLFDSGNGDLELRIRL